MPEIDQLIQWMRTKSIADVRDQLEKMKRTAPAEYQVMASFYKPKPVERTYASRSNNQVGCPDVTNPDGI